MINGNTKVVKVSFVVPVDYDNNVYKDGVHDKIIQMFGAFNVYRLEVEETTLNEIK